MDYFRRLRRIFAMYRFAAALPLTSLAFFFPPRVRLELARLRTVGDFARRLRADRIPPRRPLACAASTCVAVVAWFIPCGKIGITLDS
jgi:hypothetical protein